MKTITKHNQITQLINKSKFICDIYPITSESQVKEILRHTKEIHPKAVHHCYAYIIKKEFQNIENQSDDGEPSKTAGTPMLEILRYEDLVNVLVVVTRYFGGVLLGTGGLIKAYSSSVKKAVDNSIIVESYLMQGYTIVVSYSNLEILKHFIKVNDIHLENITYTDYVEVIIYLKNDDKLSIIRELFNGDISIIEIEKKYI